MRILHIVKSRPTDLTKKIIELHSKKYEVRIINLKKKDVFYEDVVDCIFSYDKVFTW